MISFRPIVSRLRSRRSGRSLFQSTERTVELAPATTWDVDLPIMLPDEPDRIRAHHRDSTPAMNMTLLTQRQVLQGPTRMHLLRDAIIADGTVLGPSAYDRIAPGERRAVLTGEPERIAEAALCSTHVTQLYFGHWLKDGVAHELLAADQDLQPLVLARPPWSHEGGYRALLGLDAQRVEYARCERLWLLEDWEENRHFIDRYQRLRGRVRKALGPLRDSGSRLFLARGSMAVGRGLADEVQVMAELAKRGFEILEPEKESAEHIARKLASAGMVISPEGSALSHTFLALPEGASVLTIIGAQHFNLFSKLMYDALGIRFGLTVADAVDADRFSQPIDRLLQTIDLMDARRPDR